VNWKNKTVLVTGSEGFIGSHLTEALLSRGARVRAFVLYNSFNSWGWLEDLPGAVLKKTQVVLGDVRDSGSVSAAMDGVDTVFHLAALIGIPFSYVSQETYVDTNIKGTMNVLQAARRLGTRKVIHTSTSEVYGTAQYVPINEDHPINPQSPYAATKAAADHLALSFYKSFDLPVTVLRPFNTFGPRQSARAVIPTIISQMLAQKPKIRLGNLDATRDFNYVGNTVEAFIRVAETQGTNGNVYNAGSGTEISVGEVVALVAKILNKKGLVLPDPKRFRPKKSEVTRLVCDYKRLNGVCGWEPEVSFEGGLGRTCEWMKKHKGVYKADMYAV
jgi:NAD dependent epimerase/dehydratase